MTEQHDWQGNISLARCNIAMVLKENSRLTLIHHVGSIGGAIVGKRREILLSFYRVNYSMRTCTNWFNSELIVRGTSLVSHGRLVL